MKTNSVYITDSARASLRIGEVVGTWEFFVTDRWVKEYAISLRDPNPLWYDEQFAAAEGFFKRRVAPSCVVVALNPMERSPIFPASAFWAEIWKQPDDGKKWGGHAAFNGFDLEKPVYIGDRVTCVIRNRDCFEKIGKRAILVCVETEYELRNQNGERLGAGTYGNMCQMDFPPGFVPPADAA